MSYRVLDMTKIKKEYDDFVLSRTVDESKLDENQKKIRAFFLRKYNLLKTANYKSYDIDLELGLAFYEFMNGQKDFNEYYASKYEFWETIAVEVIPDVIADRFGVQSAEHFYKKGSRVYPYVLYWYIHLSWQGDSSKTKEMLKNNTTDEILQLVERTSKIGVNLDFYRCLMREYQEPCYASLKQKVSSRARVLNKNFTLFRLVMIKNTEKLMVFRPETYPGGIVGYTKMLFDLKGELIL